MIGWAEEISLDVEWAHAIAPGANIVLVLAKSNNDADILSATKYAVDHNLGDVISQSFGENESCVDSSPAQGRARAVRQGDAEAHHPVRLVGRRGRGATDLRRHLLGPGSLLARQRPAGHRRGRHRAARGGLLPDFPGCDPSTNPAPGTYQGEVAWNEFGSSIATGGGFSVLYEAPFFQGPRGTEQAARRARRGLQRGRLPRRADVPRHPRRSPSACICSAGRAPAPRSGQPSSRSPTRRPAATWASSTQGSTSTASCQAGTDALPRRDERQQLGR